MRTPPTDLDAADLAQVLATRWGLRDLTLTYAPVGFGGHHWVADTRGRPTSFVTAGAPAAGLAAAFGTAAALHANGLDFVVAPVPTSGGAFTAPCRGYAVSVTPWRADAVDHPGTGEEVVAIASALHGATKVVRDLAATDDLALEGRAGLDAALADLDRPCGDGPYAAPLHHLLVGAADRVAEQLAVHDRAVAEVDRAGFVVTHGELKPGNLLATPDGPALVDWDTALLAPAERDLWRLPAADLAAFAARTGRPVDPAVLALYRTRWDLTDVALDVAALRAAPARTTDTAIAWATLQRLLG